jgi:hypothetical protein
VKRLPTLLLLCAGTQAAELTGTFGALKPYIDEPAGAAAGAALRVPVSRGVAIRPEFISSSQSYYRHSLGLASVTVDFTKPDRSVVGYVSAGAGAAWVREKPIDYTYVRKALLTGAGVRYTGASRFVAGAEFRVGVPAFPLLTFYAGFRFGRQRQ